MQKMALLGVSYKIDTETDAYIQKLNILSLALKNRAEILDRLVKDLRSTDARVSECATSTIRAA